MLMRSDPCRRAQPPAATIADRGAGRDGQALAGALRSNGVLEVLDVRGNAFGAAGIGMLDSEKARDASAGAVAARQILLPVSSR
jgi:hypothetical protein